MTLDGSASRDAEGSVLAYQWRVEERPSGSNATLSAPTSSRPTITPDIAGSYRISLTTSDGSASSSAAIATFTARNNSAPVALIDGPTRLVTRTPAAYSARRSTDADGDPITFYWSISERPSVGMPTITQRDTAEPTFTPDEPGTYKLRVDASDKFSVGFAEVSVLVVRPYVASFSISKNSTIDFCAGPTTLTTDTGVWELKSFCELTTPSTSPKVWVRVQNNSSSPVSVQRIFINFVCCTTQLIPAAPDDVISANSTHDYLVDLGIGPLGFLNSSFARITLGDGSNIQANISGSLVLP